MKYVSVFMSKLGSNPAVCFRWIDKTWWNNRLLLVSNRYQVVAMVSKSGRCGCAIVMSYTEINKVVSQWLLTFNLCVSVTWHLTCAFRIPCTHTHTWNHWYGLGYVIKDADRWPSAIFLILTGSSVLLHQSSNRSRLRDGHYGEYHPSQ